MKIAINTRFLLAGKMEGMGRFTYEILRRMVEAHPEHQFFFLFDRKHDPSFIFAPNITPISIFPPARHAVLFWVWYEIAVPRVLKKINADIFISPDNFCSLSTKVPTILVIHDLAYRHHKEYISPLNQRYYEYFMPRFVQRANHIVAVSEYTKTDILKKFQTDSSKISVVYNSVDKRFKPIDEPEQALIRKKYADGKPYFLYLGAIHPRKNISRLIQAFELFKEKNNDAPHQLLLVGRKAWKTNEIELIYEKTKCKKDIHFLNYIEEADLVPLLASAYYLVYVSLFEGFGLPLLEAMACGVPCISSNTSSMPEVVGEAGILADPYSVESIADGFTKVFTDKDFRQNLIAKIPEQTAKFSWEKSAERFWDIILSLKK